MSPGFISGDVSTSAPLGFHAKPTQVSADPSSPYDYGGGVFNCDQRVEMNPRISVRSKVVHSHEKHLHSKLAICPNIFYATKMRKYIRCSKRELLP